MMPLRGGLNSRRTDITSLPAELLVLVFEHGSQATLHTLGRPFAITISHVSQRWRQLVYASASVWRAIPSTSHILLDQYLKMSQNYTLDVYLHARPRVGDIGVLDIVTLLLNHSHRWRSLYIRASTAPLLFVVISRLRKARAPMLQRFELYVDAQPHTVGQLPPIFVDERPPNLASVTLEGVGFVGMPLTISVSLLTGLTSLTLSRLPRSMGQIPYASFKDLLNASPKLKHLELDSVVPKVMYGVRYDEIVLPHLQSLCLVVPPDSHYLQQLFTIVTAPSLRVLRFESGWALNWAIFEDSLSILATKYHDIKELYFSVTLKPGTPMVNDGVDPAFFKAFPHLRQFSLSVLDDAFATYYLLPWIGLLTEDLQSDEEKSPLPDSAMVWPQLDLLTVRAPYDAESLVGLDECLEMLGTLRMSMGLPFDLQEAFIFADNETLSSSISVELEGPPGY
ncbi:hypothetical protein EIP91_006618 [Steccherinum ochraceum]|uniref:F-box domain-containing protein n=1 Tax=Steccherinum ochraceum TaxID=92696 RepID=A0A4R0RK07_9APHY|nr:hypothetical protein EIP91_006618 [Steccherinum ochraceum]